MVKIAITGGYGYGNIGDEGILASMLSSIKEGIEDAEFTILSNNVDDTKHWHKGNKIINSLDKYLDPICWIWSIPQLFLWYILYDYKDIQRFLDKRIGQIIGELENVDAIVLSGGGYFNDTWIRAFPGRVFQFYIFKKINKPTMIFAQSVGPFRFKITKKIACRALNKIDLITVRDYESRKILDHIKVNKPDIYVTADQAILLKPADDSITDLLLNNLGVDLKNNAYVGFTIKKYTDYVSKEGFSKSNEISKNNYHLYLAETIDYLIENYNLSILIMPSTNWSFDLNAATQVVKLIKNKGNVKMLDAMLSPEELKGLIGRMDAFISTNLHPLIFASAQKVPIVSISYWYKVDNFMDLLNLSDFNVFIDNFDSTLLKEKMSYIFSNKIEVQSKLNKNVKALEAKARQNVDLLSNLINKHS